MADNVTIPNGDVTFWRAYGQFVRNLLLGPNTPAPGIDFLYPLAPTEFGLRGGRPIPDAVTNFNVTNFANSLQTTDSPLFTTLGLGYFESLEQYLNSVQVKQITDDQKEKLREAKETWQNSRDEYKQVKTQAQLQYGKDKDAKERKISFPRWCRDNAPEVLEAERQVNLDQTSLRTLQNRFYGASFNALGNRLRRIEAAASENSSNPGVNMPCFNMDYDIDEVALRNDTRVENIDPSNLIFKPLYAIPGYESACDRWIKKETGDNTVFTSKLSQFTHNDWTELGYSRSVSHKSNSFWIFFNRSSSSTHERTTLNFSGSDWRNETEITLTAEGAVQNFTVTAGIWDVPGVRNLHPVLNPDERDTALGLVRINRILVGYKIGVKITFARSLRTQVRDMIRDARQDTEGGLRIFGFQFGADTENTSSFTRDINSVKYTEESGVLTIPPTPDGVPFVLGMLGKKITRDS